MGTQFAKQNWNFDVPGAGFGGCRRPFLVCFGILEGKFFVPSMKLMVQVSIVLCSAISLEPGVGFMPNLHGICQ